MVKKYLPNPFTLAILLTIIVYALGIIFTQHGPLKMVVFWGNGVFGLLGFTMQMVLILITGHALANSPIVAGFLKRLASIPNTPTQAIMFIAALGYICSYISWAFGIIAGAIIAKAIAKQQAGNKLHFPMLIAAAYSGNIVRGPASSIPLAVATPKHFLEDLIGVIPVTETLYTSWNLIITLALFIAIPILFYFMAPSDEKGDIIIEANASLFGEDETGKAYPKILKGLPFSEMIDNSMLLNMVVGFAGIVYIVNFFATNGFQLDMNIVIFIFLTTGIIAHKTPMRYCDAINVAIRSAGAIALQFPFYAGIMGIMRSSGLAVIMSELFVSIATAKTLPLYTFWSAGLVNIFVPSGGGQWAVQGPVMISAATKLGADAAKVTMALCWGDSWTNQIQPFWALPLLAITGLGVRDIMGYCAMVLILSGVIISLGFILL